MQLTDPLGIGPALHARPWYVSQDEWEVGSLLNGSRTTTEVAALITGENANEKFVRSTIELFSKHFVLDDEAFEEQLVREIEAFRSQTHRQLVGSGREYSSDNIDLRIQLGGIVANDWDMPEIPPLHGLLLPACGFGAAARLYSRGYAALRHQVPEIDRIVLLGASPAKLRRLLVPLTMPSKSAFGISPLDTEAIRALAVVPGREEIAHRDALVLERHQLFTTLLAPKVPLLPILVGQIGDLADAEVGESVESAVDALGRVLALPGRTVMIAACDFAHFDPKAVEAAPREVRARDADLSDLATKLEAADYWRAVTEESSPIVLRDHSTIYLLLRALANKAESMPTLRGAVAGYLQMRSDADLTTAASLTFFEE